ncbi:hypothetical protein WN944_021983 [Citrus x changshan-huyou]|uniref:Uncharacterized protein n=3 Tax=Citrus TaxID=2706 RepID=A0ACB8J963_CITSI|nr:hypothetical protein KPL71_020574 [Citrus sinensis]KDO36087.1 hypothetical protein CISIN_1g033613mg [Citrus sinensis]
MANINTCCPIEMEPKTLREVQLNHAIEVAADAVQKMEPEEASISFIKDSEAVGVEEKERTQKGQQFPNAVDCNVADDQKTMNPIIKTPCQCSLMNVNVDSPDQINLKEPLSAPF